MPTHTETTVYVTKYAISDGIVEKEGYIDGNGYFAYKSNPCWRIRKGDYFLSRAEAIAAAEKMRDKRIASLKKQIAKLEKMTF